MELCSVIPNKITSRQGIRAKDCPGNLGEHSSSDQRRRPCELEGPSLVSCCSRFERDYKLLPRFEIVHLVK